MVAQFKIVLLAAIFAAARSQAPVGGPHGRPHVARYLRGEGREDEEAPALHYFATDPEWKYVAVRRTASEPVELFDVASESDKPVARFAFKGEPPEIYAGATEYIILLLKYDLNEVLVDPKQVGLESITFMFFPDPSCASTVSPIALSVLAALASPAEKHSEVRYTSRETGYREVR